jgi:methylase of polypeptide subunit release factors
MTFADAVARELEKARSQHARINSAHEGYAVILEELQEFWAEVMKKRERRDPLQMLHELIQVGAMAQRVCEDVVEPMLPASARDGRCALARRRKERE